MSLDNTVIHNTEDKDWWCQYGMDHEFKFVELCNSKLGINAKINPEKKMNKYAPDLIVDGVVADLKTQNTPFFTCRKYSMNPQYTVTFNRKDYERYSCQYPNINIYFWVDWKKTTWQDIAIKYLGGIYVSSFTDIKNMIEKNPKEHSYLRRENSHTLNAKSSFLLDVRCFKQLFQTTTI